MVVIRERRSLHKHFSREYTHVRYLRRTKVKIIHLAKQAFSHKCMYGRCMSKTRLYLRTPLRYDVILAVRFRRLSRRKEWQQKKREQKERERINKDQYDRIPYECRTRYGSPLTWLRSPRSPAPSINPLAGTFQFHRDCIRCTRLR